MALSKEEKGKVIKEFSLGTADTGSTEVQIALLTKGIKELTKHCQENPKDYSSKRGLLRMVCRRSSFLRYLQREDAQKYKFLIGKLGLRK